MSSKPIKFAIIGCGRIAYRHAEAINNIPGAKLVAVCDLNLEKAKELADKNHVPCFDNYHEMLQKINNIDVVCILTPSGMHYEHAVEIIKGYKKHIVLEKPMVLRLEQGDALKKLADKAEITIFPIYQNRFNKAVQKVKKSIQDGELGDLRVGTVRVRWCRPQKYYDLSSWRGTWALDGGAITNQGIHYIDILRYLGGEVKQVNSIMKTFGAAIEVEDTAVAILEFHSGALGVIEIMTSARPDNFEASVSCVCSNGMAIVGGVATNELVAFSPDEENKENYNEDFTNVYGKGHDLLFKAIVENINNATPPAIAFDDGFATIRLLHALYRSNELKRWVALDEIESSAFLGKADEQLMNEYRIFHTPAEGNT